MKKTANRRYALRTETVRVLTTESTLRVHGGGLSLGSGGQSACPSAMCQEDGTSSTLDGGCYQTGNC